MAAYLIADVDVKDPEMYKGYSAYVPATIEQFGGRFLVRGGASEILEGEWTPHRTVVLEFPDMDTLQRWYRSDAYSAILGIRESAAVSSVIVVEGV